MIDGLLNPAQGLNEQSELAPVRHFEETRDTDVTEPLDCHQLIFLDPHQFHGHLTDVEIDAAFLSQWREIDTKFDATISDRRAK